MALLWYFKKILQIALTQNRPQSQLMNSASARAGQPGSSSQDNGASQGRESRMLGDPGLFRGSVASFPPDSPGGTTPPLSPSPGWWRPGSLLGRSDSPASLNKGRGPPTSFWRLHLPDFQGFPSSAVLWVMEEGGTGRKDVLRFSSEITLLGSQRNLRDPQS